MTTAELKQQYVLVMVSFAINRAKQNSRCARLERGSDKPEYCRLRKESMLHARGWREQLIN